jgi:pimeloyl-ACP methyl ester carboxylesterase
VARDHKAGMNDGGGRVGEPGAVVLVHGAWHGPWCWDGVVAELDRHGVPAIAVELPFTGFDDDVSVARRAIEQTGCATVVVGHSYGGAVISQAASRVPNVCHLVYVGAFVPDVGDDDSALLASHGSKLFDGLVVTDAGVAVDPVAARALFYGDSDDATARDLVARLRPMTLAGAPGPGSDPAWKSVPSTYVLCANDGAFPPEAQRAVATRADEVVEWPTDHSPFVTRPKELADLVVSVLHRHAGLS